MNSRSTPILNKLTQGLLLKRKYAAINTIEKSVIISESNDIYTNLALEDWYYRNWKSQNKHMLILWSNNPCVVIGKFQNPWLEANVSELDHLIPGGVRLARRNSGGGTVYHDRGNLNITFFTPRDHYDRKHNLEIIVKAVLKEYGVKIDITKRDDLVIGDCKVSGTAAKLARTVAYHHCTLLINSDKTTLKASLKHPEYEIKTNASQSTKSKIINLIDLNKNITVEDLMVCIGQEYLLTVPDYAKQKNDESNIHLQVHNAVNSSDITKFRILRPTEAEFPGLTEIRDTLISWEWIFGKCPKFTATKTYPYMEETTKNETLKITFAVENGKVRNAEVEFSTSNTNNLNIELGDYVERKFEQLLFQEVFDSICQRLKMKESIQ